MVLQWQVFYGGWLADRYYEAGKEGRQLADDLRMIHMQHNYISMTGHYLTDEPIYSIIESQGDFIEAIKIQINNEWGMVSAACDFFKTLLQMMQKADEDFAALDEAYAKTKI